MDRGAWWATVHRIAESDMTEQLTLSIFNVLFGGGKGKTKTKVHVI